MLDLYTNYIYTVCIRYVLKGKENVMEKVETSRINLNMPCDLVYRVDEYASNMNINRTSAICVLLNLALDSQKAMNDLGQLLKLYQDEQKKKG